ncbi:MAG: TIGR02710 family CRISPR-associated protein [Anaerolineae bacterium]|nr:TIGR02710 family CRISPR-associated protein [Anaerolineae bacterium]
MTIVLALTVGGSCAPIVTAIRDYEPDHVCFLASTGPRGSRMVVDGPGRPCDEGRSPSIVNQLGLDPQRYQVVELSDPDALADLYAVCRAALRDLRSRFPDARCIADYTGGSKSMGAALAMAAVSAGWELSLVKGQRTDLVQVAQGTEISALINVWEVRARQRMEEALQLFNDFAYAPAIELLAVLQRTAPLSSELQRTARGWIAYARGFDAWDRFDHARAARILDTVPGEGIDWRFLKTLTGQIRGCGYEPVLDLFLNADRRAARGRFDDAVARLYRALELLAQTRMRQREPPLDSSDMDVAVLPDEIRPRYERMRQIAEIEGLGPKVKLGLMEDYALLESLGDPLGRVFAGLEGPLRDAIQKRNKSILAHGLEPLTRGDYQAMRAVAETLFGAGLRALGEQVHASQFPLLGPDGLHPRERSRCSC